MASFVRSVFEPWFEEDFGLGQYALGRAAPAQHPDDFILPPPSADETAVPETPQTPFAAVGTVNPRDLEPFPLARPGGEIFFDVDGDGAADKIVQLLDPHYVPPILDLI